MMRKSRLSKPYKCGLIFHWSDHNAAAYRVETLRAPSLCSGV